MKLCALALALFALAGASGQDAASSYRLVMSYDRPGLQVPHWQITIPQQGAAEYIGKPEKGNDPGSVLFQLSSGGRVKIGSMLSRTKGLQPCETKSKGLANMGMKDVTYTPSSGQEAHCAFNYTDNKPLGEFSDYMLALAGTLQAGLELERLHRYDRLGLDPVILRLAEDAKTGHAVEIGAIQATLQSLITDEALLDRVRSKAQQLLELAKVQAAAKP